MRALTSSVVHTEPSRHVTGHQHDPGAGHAGDLGAHLAQPLRLQIGGPRLPTSRAENPKSPFTGHRSGSPATGTVRGGLVRPRPAAADDTRPVTKVRPASLRSSPTAGLGEPTRRHDRLQGPPPAVHRTRSPRAEGATGRGIEETGQAKEVDDTPRPRRGDRSVNDRDRTGGRRGPRRWHRQSPPP